MKFPKKISASGRARTCANMRARRPNCAICDWIADHSSYMTGDFDNPADFVRLKDKMAELDRQHQTRRAMCFTTSPRCRNSFRRSSASSAIRA